MKRDALVVGINQYPFLKDTPTSKAKHLKTPAGDAEAIAHLLETYGEFEVQRLPATNRDGKLQVDPQKLVTIKDLQKAITELFQPSGQQVPETAVLFFTGHGLRRIQGDCSEGYLGTSDANPKKDVWGISLQWLRQLLQQSPVRQQIIWLDCCHSGEFLNFIESDLGEYEKGRDRCFIVASRDFQVAYEAAEGNHGVLSGALLQGLDPTLQAEKWVTNYSLVDFVKQALKDAPQHPICTNSGGQITLTGEQSVISSICPYKGLAYFDFNEEDPKYFYGRTALTNQLLEKVRRNNFLAVLGASGSGKSSVVRAGLLHHLKLGEAIPGSDRWKIYQPFTPSEHPLKRFEEAIGVKANQIEPIIKAAAAERVVVVVDQFEEAFTLCRDEAERQQFFEYLMRAVERLENKLCLVLAMRADFFGKCAEQEYAGLAKKIEQNLVIVLPMSHEELREAIIQPALQVGLEIDRELVTEIIADVSGSPGDLPLMQYTLTELWEQKTLNRLTISDYTRLGGVKTALEKRANEVYQSLSEDDKLVAKRIFLELTRLGEATEDTRKQLFLEDLVNSQPIQTQLEQVVQRLVDAKLLVTGEQDLEGKRVAVVNIPHEALIRNWNLLGKWLQENRAALLTKQDIEDAAREWRDKGKPKDSAYFLQGQRLVEAEKFSQSYANTLPMSDVANEFVQRGIKQRRNRRRTLVGSVSAVVVLLTTVGVVANNFRTQAGIETTHQQLRAKAARVRDLLSVEPTEGLLLAIEATGQSQDRLHQVLGQVQSSLRDAVEISRERNILRGHKDSVASVAFSVDGQYIVSGGSLDCTVQLWSIKGKEIAKIFQGNQGNICGIESVAVSSGSDSQIIASGSSDGKIRLSDIQGNKLIEFFIGHNNSVNSVAFSPDGRILASGSSDGKIRLWNIQGKKLGEFIGHNNSVNCIVFSPDGRILASGGNDNIIRLWNTKGEKIDQIFIGPNGGVNSVTFSPDGRILASADMTVRLWDAKGKKISQPFQGLEAPVYSVSPNPEGNPNPVSSIAFSPDGKTLVSVNADGMVRLWDTRGHLIGQPLLGHKAPINSVAFSPDGKYLVSVSDDATIRLWDTKSKLNGQPLLGHDTAISSVASNLENQLNPVYFVSFSQDGQTIISVSANKIVRLWDRKGKPIKKWSISHKDSVNSFAFSPVGQKIVSISEDGTVRLWNIQGKHIGNLFLEPHSTITSVAFSPDGQKIISGSRDGTARLWDIYGKQIGKPFQGYMKNPISSLAFSPDGQKIAGVSEDGAILLWDIHGKQIAKPFQGNRTSIHSFAFSPDGQKMAIGTGDWTMNLWDLQRSQVEQSFRGFKGLVNSVAFSTDGQILITGSHDNTVRWWDLQGNQIGQPLPVHRGHVYSVAFSPDGQTVVSGHEDGTVLLWSGSWQVWLEIACERLQHHPIFKNPKPGVEEGAYKTCQKYVWKE